MRILPQEVQFSDKRASVSIRTKVPKQEIDEGEHLVHYAKVRGLMAGDHMAVQIMDDTNENLLAEADFVVTRMKKMECRIEDGNTFRTVIQTDCKVVRTTDWWDAQGAPEVEPQLPDAPALLDERRTEHAGHGKYRVVSSLGEVLAEGLDKGEATEIAAGRAPLP